MKVGYVAAGLALMLAGVSSAAMAKVAPAPTTYVMKYSGTVLSGYDIDDLFGGGNLKGDTYSEVFDVTAADILSVPGGMGDAGSGRADPISLATLTINGKTVSLGSSAVSLDGGKSMATSGDTGIVTLIDTRSKGLLFDAQSDTVCKSRSDCITYTIAGGIADYSSGKAFPTSLKSSWDLKTGGGIVDGGSLFSVSGPCGYGEGLLLGVTSAAPEPNTWLLMFAGVGLLGAALRRRQSVAVVA